jgi:uncharacterized protein with NAD-binding domain and iron-sulfur cluster
MASVAVLGGGVGGLSAAHELAKRGFKVTVYEARDVFGGKARSIPVPNTAREGVPPLPGEHGFRFFPGFYRHLDATMSEIPYKGRTVKDNLVTSTDTLMARADGENELIAPMSFPLSLGELGKLANFMFTVTMRLGIKPAEFALFLERILAYLTSCDERRLHEFEKQSWWDFIRANEPGRSDAYKRFLATGMTRTLVAARAEEMSARTGCAVLCQLMQDMMKIRGRVDRVLNGPTSEVWIDPWVRLLRKRNVVFKAGCRVAGIHCDGSEITRVTVENDNVSHEIEADYYVAAIPKERLQELLTSELVRAEPRLARITRLQVRSMNGVMFYLDTDVPLVRGHSIFIDSAWALTAISQQQFWSLNLEDRGDGRVEGILSVDVSDWTKKGPKTGKQAVDCTADEIFTEVWGQMVDHLDRGELDDTNVLYEFLDPAIKWDPATQKNTNSEELLINTKGSWINRPDAVTKIPNFFIASDFVRTHTDLATMEGANEAARRAVNGILEKEGRQDLCGVFPLREPLVFAPFRAADAVLWKLGFRGPKKSPILVTELAKLSATDLTTDDTTAGGEDRSPVG